MLDMERLTYQRAQGNWDELIREVPVGLNTAREQVGKLLHEVENQMKVSPPQILIGGFSQGAMLACDLILRTERSFAGLVVLSGSIIAKDEWAPLISTHQGLRVFQSHGVDDPLLACTVAQQLRDRLRDGGLDVEWHEFRGGHEIPMHVLEQLGQFIRTVWKD